MKCEGQNLPLAGVCWGARQYEGDEYPFTVLPSDNVESKSAGLLVEDHLSCFPADPCVIITTFITIICRAESAYLSHMFVFIDKLKTH